MAINEKASRDATSKAPVLVYSVNQGGFAHRATAAAAARSRCAHAAAAAAAAATNAAAAAHRRARGDSSGSGALTGTLVPLRTPPPPSSLRRVALTGSRPAPESRLPPGAWGQQWSPMPRPLRPLPKCRWPEAREPCRTRSPQPRAQRRQVKNSQSKCRTARRPPPCRGRRRGRRSHRRRAELRLALFAPFKRFSILPPNLHLHIFIDMGADTEAVCPYCSTLYKHNPKLGLTESIPADAHWHDQAA